MAFQDTHLVGEHYLCREIVVGGDASKRITLVAQCLIEVFAGFINEIHHALFLNESTQCQRVDKHADSVADAQVGTSITDCGYAQLLIVSES